jgi:predicted phage tail protein
MKTIHSLFLSVSLLFISLASSAANPWPEVSAPKWELKEQRVHISWTADADASDVVYIIEKSQDGKNFTTATMLLGGFQHNQNFEFACRLKHEAGMYYRIRQVNKEGAARVLDTKLL